MNASKKKLVLNSFEELEHHLRDCIHWYTTENVGQYDVVGMATLLSALLENLSQNTHKSKTKDIRKILSDKNVRFLKDIVTS